MAADSGSGPIPRGTAAAPWIVSLLKTRWGWTLPTSARLPLTFGSDGARRRDAARSAGRCLATQRLDDRGKLLGVVRAELGKQLVSPQDEAVRAGVTLDVHRRHPGRQRLGLFDDRREHPLHRQLIEQTGELFAHVLNAEG